MIANEAIKGHFIFGHDGGRMKKRFPEGKRLFFFYNRANEGERWPRAETTLRRIKRG